MTLTILVSFSLLALVVTARPILPRDAQELYVFDCYSSISVVDSDLRAG